MNVADNFQMIHNNIFKTVTQNFSFANGRTYWLRARYDTTANRGEVRVADDQKGLPPLASFALIGSIAMTQDASTNTLNMSLGSNDSGGQRWPGKIHRFILTDLAGAILVDWDPLIDWLKGEATYTTSTGHTVTGTS